MDGFVPEMVGAGGFHGLVHDPLVLPVHPGKKALVGHAAIAHQFFHPEVCRGGVHLGQYADAPGQLLGAKVLQILPVQAYRPLLVAQQPGERLEHRGLS